VDRRRPGFAAAGLLAAALLAAALLGVVAAAEGPVTDERIVRECLAGAGTEELLALVRSEDAELDASPEMLDEMKRAGVPPEVLRETERRAREAAQPPRIAEGPTGRLTLLLNPGRTKPKQRRIRVSDAPPLDLVYAWSLGTGEEDRRFTDVAIFVACSVAEHVPDRWRSLTPLESESGAIPRHRMLAFLDGAAWGRSSLLGRLGLGGPEIERNEDGSPARRGPAPDDPPGVLELPIPERIEVDLAAGVSHELQLGIALRTGPRFRPWTVTTLSDVTVGDAPLTLEVSVTGAGLDRLALDVDAAARKTYRARTTCARGCPAE